MTEISLAASDLVSLRERLLGNGVEGCAVLLASQVKRSDRLVRLLVRHVQFPTDHDYSAQGHTHAELRPEFVARMSKLALRANQSIIFVHSHPGESPPRFSRVDDAGERLLADFLTHRHPGRTHAALVLSAGGLRARKLGAAEEIRVVSFGVRRIIEFNPEKAGKKVSKQYDRQIRAFGRQGQKAIEELTVGIVGLGGTGSIAVQQLMHLGVRKFVLIDPDVIEKTNLNRVVGAHISDVGAPKVLVAKNAIELFDPKAQVLAVVGDLTRAKTASALFDTDFIFGCTDSHGSRAVLQQVSYQYLIPCIDMGSTITTNDGNVTGIFGRVQMMAPGLACLTCSNLLDPEQVRRDMMSKFERTLDPYIVGGTEPAPSVISLNGTVVSLAVTMFMAVVAGIPSEARYLIYNAKNSSLRSVGAAPKNNCYICSKKGALARGDSMPLYARQG